MHVINICFCDKTTVYIMSSFSGMSPSINETIREDAGNLPSMLIGTLSFPKMTTTAGNYTVVV